MIWLIFPKEITLKEYNLLSFYIKLFKRKNSSLRDSCTYKIKNLLSLRAIYSFMSIKLSEQFVLLCVQESLCEQVVLL